MSDVSHEFSTVTDSDILPGIELIQAVPEGLELRNVSQLSPDDFKTLVGFLASKGVGIKPLTAEELATGHESEPEVFLHEYDFVQLAQANGFEKGRGTRAWNSLSWSWRMYDHVRRAQENGQEIIHSYQLDRLNLPQWHKDLFLTETELYLSRLKAARISGALVAGSAHYFGTKAEEVIDAIIRSAEERHKNKTETST